LQLLEIPIALNELTLYNDIHWSEKVYRRKLTEAESQIELEISMKRRMILAIVVLAAILTAFITVRPSRAADQTNASADTGPLQVLKSFQVGGGRGGWDYLTVDPNARRLYVSHASHVMVLDADQGTPIGEITETLGVHGIALVPDCNEGFTSNGRENMLSVFDLKTLKTLRKIKSGQNPDSIIYDPASKKVFAFNGRSGDITIVDPTATDKEPVTLPVGGKLETGVSDGAGHVYVNVEDKSEIVAIDSIQMKVLAHWPIAPGEEPTGLALDKEHHRLFSGCSNQMMVILDAETGKILATVAIGQGVDGVTFDQQLGLAISANGGDGTITAVKEEPNATFKVVQTLKTARGARTITSDPKSHRIYLPCNLTENDESQFSVLVVGAAQQQ
jgi:DNA-binding beta-propeller fold protein YncE